MAEYRIENMSFSYTKAGPPVLKNIHLTIDDGDFVCIAGPSGCGKTTLLRLLAGLALPTAGSIKMNGQTITGPGTDRGIVFQNYTLFPWMVARKNVEFGIQQAKKDLSHEEVQDIANQFLKKVKMEEDGDKYPFELSGGMRQRIAIARALAMDADTLLLDEPFGALDPKIRANLQDLLVELWDNAGNMKKTVICVTHDIDEAVRLGNRIFFMDQGTISNEISVDLPRIRHFQDPINGSKMCGIRRQLYALFDKSGAVTEK